MDTLRTLLIGALVGAPLVAWGLSWLEPWLSRRAMQTSVGVAALLSLLSVWGLLLGTPEGQAVAGPIVSWLRIPGFDVTLGVRLDRLAAMQMTLTAIVLLLMLSACPRSIPWHWLMLAWFGVTLANVAGNLGQLFFGWSLSAWASSELARQPDREHGASPAFRPVWLVQRISEVALLAGIGLAWTQFDDSLEFAAWTPEAIGALRPELVESIALCVLIGIIGRCAQLPLTVWLETESGFAARAGHSMAKLSDELVGVWNVPNQHLVAERLKADPRNRWHEANRDSTPAAVLAWWLSAVFLPVGIGLQLRFESLFAVAPHTRLLMVAVGAFTLLMCSANAAAQNNWPRVLCQIAVGQCGLILVALGLEQVDVEKITLLFYWQSVIIGVLLVATRTEVSSSFRRVRLSGAVLFAILCFASGLWGRHLVMNFVWQQNEANMSRAERVVGESASLVFGSTESRVWMLVVGMVCVAELLTSFALLRAWFSDRQHRAMQKNSAQPVAWGVWLTLGGLIIGGVFGFQPSLLRLDFLSPLLPLSAVGMVLAWWMYSKPSALPEKFSTAMGPFARLSRNRFYWDDLYFLLIVHPVTIFGGWLRWFDERVLGSGARTWRSRLLKSVGESAEPLVAGTAMIGALTTFSSVAVLVWMLLWLKS